MVITCILVGAAEILILSLITLTRCLHFPNKTKRHREEAGICGIGLAATPGTSNHEGGRAIDTSYYDYWLTTLQNYGWVHSYPSSDPVHFDYMSVADIAQQNLKAFQTVYNQYNPSVPISEDGIFGPATATALYNAPCDGW
jgi:hypothetical protein